MEAALRAIAGPSSLGLISHVRGPTRVGAPSDRKGDGDSKRVHNAAFAFFSGRSLRVIIPINHRIS